MSDYRIALALGRGELAVKTWHAEQGLPIIAVHGWMDNAGTFNYLAPLLSGHAFHAVDLPGHGLSDPRPDGMRYHNADFLDDLYAAMQHIAPNNGPLILLGHSLGAGLLMLLAGIFPERIKALVMIDGLGPISAEPSNYATDTRAALEGLAAYSPRRKPIASVEQAIDARRQGITGMLSERASAALCERALMEDEAGELSWRTDKRLRLNSLMRYSEEQVIACIAAITAPCLLITGDSGLPNQLGKHKPRYAERLSHFKQLQQVSLPGGHHLHLDDCPEQVAEAINAFLAAQRG
ncbi:MAG: alpha/beta fold hydrolase [Paraperlucidibaca sp.]